MLYFQKPILSKIKEKQITDDKIKRLTIKYLNLCNASREKATENKNGIFEIKDLGILKKDIIVFQKNLPKEIVNKELINYTSIKPSLASKLMSYTGITGYYNPFTAEAQYNQYTPSTNLPFTIAHETAHQLGYAKEQEASFIAYIIAKKSNNVDLQYSIQLYVLKSLLNSLSTNNKNELFIKSILTSYSIKMKRDRVYEINFKKEHESILNDILSYINDLFLKSNQQDGSISYSYFVNLVIDYEL